MVSARKALLVVVEVVSGLVFGLIFGLLTLWLLFDWESTSEEVFLVPDARLTLAAAHEALAAETGRESVPDRFLLEGHHLSPGKGLVVAYRRRDGWPFDMFLSDKASFQYLTLWLPQGAADAAATYDLAAAGGGYGFYSAANYGFSRSAGCFGVARSGTVTIERGGGERPGGATVRFDLQIQTKPLGAMDAEHCGRVEFTGVLRAEIIALARLDQRPTTPHGEDELADCCVPGTPPNRMKPTAG